MLNEYNFVSRSVEYLIEALQEQMNIHNVNYDKMNKVIPSRTDSRLNMDMVKERAQIQLSHVINELSSLEMTCMVRRKRNL
jgi:predicted Rossmann fold nucleotide-binding protein DprA/Smf involved in DNA uptake